MPDVPDGVPRVEDLFSRAVVAQLAEQRAQRETFAEVERKLDRLEQLVSERLPDASDARSARAPEPRPGGVDDAINERLGRLEETLRADVGRRLETVGDQLVRIEDALRADRRRLSALEASVAERIGHLEEAVRSEEIGRRLKALELAVEERSSRLEGSVRTTEVERRLESLQQTVDERLEGFGATLEDDHRDERLDALDQAVGDRLTRVEGSLRRLEEQTAAGLDDLRAASTAAEAGILDRIVAESQVIAEHFRAVRPVMEAVAHVGPDFEEALAELRRMAEAARASTVAGPPPDEAAARHEELSTPGPGDASPYSEAAIQAPAGDDAPDTVFLPPEETPIPERRFGGLLPRRER